MVGWWGGGVGWWGGGGGGVVGWWGGGGGGVVGWWGVDLQKIQVTKLKSVWNYSLPDYLTCIQIAKNAKI